jgi:polar amino acid transport system permease protein
MPAAGRPFQEPSHSGWRLFLDILKMAALAALLSALMARATEGLGYHWQWYRLPRYLLEATEKGWSAGLLLNGVAVTLQIALVSLALAFTFGLAAALLRLSHSILGRLLSRLYLELIRNTPLLVQLFFFYFVCSPLFGLSGFTSAVLSLSLFEGAYISEIIRAGILSVPRGQWEAAVGSGLSPWSCYRRVILPQAVRPMLPPLTSQAIALVKDSALVSTIAVYDLTMQAQAIISETYLVFEVWFTVALIYLGLTLALSGAVTLMQKRTGPLRAL